MRKGWTCLLLAAALLIPVTSHAQVAWDAPMLLPPMPEPGLGIFLADTYGGGLGVIGTWRSPSRSYGFRLGLAEDRGDDDVAVLGGIDYTGRVNRANRDFPLDIDWLLGGGLSIGDDVWASFPLGLTGAHTFRGQDATFTPFFTPRVTLDALFRDNDRGDDSDLDLGFSFDLGLDLRLRGGGGAFQGVTIRFAASFGDHEAIAIGLVF